MGRARRAVRSASARLDGERGSAVAEFVLVSVLVLALLLGVVQVVLSLYVRALLIDAAAEGARVAARADTVAADGTARTANLVEATLSSRYAQDISVRDVEVDGLPVVEVTVRAPLPIVGTLGPDGAMTVRGHAVREPS